MIALLGVRPRWGPQLLQYNILGRPLRNSIGTSPAFQTRISLPIIGIGSSSFTVMGQGIKDIERIPY
jgi:hypothetical protein